MSLLKISSPAFQKAHDGSKIAREMSSAVSPSKGSSSASWMLTSTQFETEKKTLSLCVARSGRGRGSGVTMGDARAGRPANGPAWAEQPSPRPGHTASSGAHEEAWPASERPGRGKARCCGGGGELPLCLPADARVGSDGTGAVVRGSLVGKGRCKNDGEEVGCGGEEAPQHERCAKGAHLGSPLVQSGGLLSQFRVRGGAGGYGFAACAAVLRRCLGGSSYQAQRLEAGEQRALVEQEAADDGLDVHVYMLWRVDA